MSPARVVLRNPTPDPVISRHQNELVVVSMDIGPYRLFGSLHRGSVLDPANLPRSRDMARMMLAARAIPLGPGRISFGAQYASEAGGKTLYKGRRNLFRMGGRRRVFKELRHDRP